MVASISTGDELPTSIVGKENEGGALIGSGGQPVWNLRRFQLHLHLIHSYVLRADDQHDGTVRRLSRRGDQPGMERDLRPGTPTVRGGSEFVSIRRRTGTAAPARIPLHVDGTNHQEFLDVVRIDDAREMLSSHVRAKSTFNVHE